MQARYELFDHTADIGVRAYAPTLSGLIEPATRGLYEVIGELVADAGAAAEQVRFELSRDEPAVMLRDYLAEILRLFETHKQIVTDLDVEEFSERRLDVLVRIRPVDPGRSEYAREIKAVTYHELRIRPLVEEFEATYIVDI
jgi:SHS2 domain-containing protein